MTETEDKSVERYGHGGDRWTAGELFRRAAEDFVDFSANINPLGPPEEVIRALRESLEEQGAPALTRYPDPRSRSLKRALSHRYKVGEESILVGNGGAELIDLVNEAVQPSRVGVTAPSFAEYEASARKRGQEVIRLAAGEDRGFQPDPDALAGWIRSVELAYLGHPNNPTGLPLPPALLERAAREAAEAGTVLAVDEAFLDFVPGGEEKSLLPRLEEFPTTVILRSMTKFYALPGLRLGWGVAHPDIVRAVEARQIPWSVNGLAQRAGVAALGAPGFDAATRRWLEEERFFLLKGLSRLPCLEPVPGAANYSLLKLTGFAGGTEKSPSRRLQRTLGERGILIRDGSTYPGLDGSYVRVAVRGRAENRLLLAALQEVWKEEGDRR